MCGRNSIGFRPVDFSERYGLETSPDFEPSYNVSPRDVTPLVTLGSGEIQGVMAEWCFVPEWGEYRDWRSRGVINARLESVDSNKAFRNSWKESRCLVPSTGFYEWKEKRGAKSPFFFHRDGEIFSMAGLASRVEVGGQEVWTYAVITKPAESSVSQVHDREPVVLEQSEELDFVSGAFSKSALLDREVEFEKRLVGREVNDPNADGESLIKQSSASLEDFA